MPPLKVFIFIGSLVFILLVGFLLQEPGSTKEIPCATGLHTHDGGEPHCD